MLFDEWPLSRSLARRCIHPGGPCPMARIGRVGVRNGLPPRLGLRECSSRMRSFLSHCTRKVTQCCALRSLSLLHLVVTVTSAHHVAESGSFTPTPQPILTPTLTRISPLLTTHAGGGALPGLIPGLGGLPGMPAQPTMPAAPPAPPSNCVRSELN